VACNVHVAVAVNVHDYDNDRRSNPAYAPPVKHLLLAVICLAACGKSGSKAASAPVDPAPINEAVRALSDRVCACGTDHACVKYARADWDAGKRAWLEARKTFNPQAATLFDLNTGKMAACGDAAGLTFWREL
jgi:hypothetical protein